MNPDSTDIRSNAAGRVLFGEDNKNLSQSAAEQERPNFRVFSEGHEVAPEDLPMQVAGRTGRAVEATECELRFDNGVVKFIRGRAVPVFGRDGDVRGTIGVFLDVTAVRDKEQQHLLELEEIKHRAKNTLAIVLSVANSTLKPELDPGVYDAFEHRLQTISRTIDVFAHDYVNQSMRQILRITLEHQVGKSIKQIRLTGSDVLVPMKSHTALGMAIHELATNACKYGALSTNNGEVTISWEVIDNGELVCIHWIERGGPPVVAPTRCGFGSKLLNRIMGSPSGRNTKIIYDERGVECSLYLSIG